MGEFPFRFITGLDSRAQHELFRNFDALADLMAKGLVARDTNSNVVSSTSDVFTDAIINETDEISLFADRNYELHWQTRLFDWDSPSSTDRGQFAFRRIEGSDESAIRVWFIEGSSGEQDDGIGGKHLATVYQPSNNERVKIQTAMRRRSGTGTLQVDASIGSALNELWVTDIGPR